METIWKKIVYSWIVPNIQCVFNKYLLSKWSEEPVKEIGGNSLAVQWLVLGAFTAKGLRWISGWETKIP